MTVTSDDTNARLRHRIEFEAGASNDIILSNAEAELAREMLQNAENALDALDRQINTLWQRPEYKQDCNQVERQWVQTATRVERLRIALAPQKRLPPELLSYIFVLSAGSPPHALPPPTNPNSPEMPWVLRRVCSRWRLVALNERRLWNNLSLNITIEEGFSEKAQLWALRSAEHLLPIILPKSGSLSFSLLVDGASVQRAIDLIITPYADRLIELYLALPGSSYPLFSTMLQSQLKSLKSFQLQILDSLPADAASIRSLPPSLRQLSLAGDSSAFPCIRSSALSWEHLTDLDIGEVNVQFSNIAPILKSCTRLQTCHISVFGNGCGKHITLPFLRHLRIKLEDSGTMFDDFTLPSLKQLFMSYEEEFPGFELSSMFRRSACSLEVFSWYHVLYMELAEIDTAALSTVLAACPSLYSLTAHNDIIPTVILNRIRHRDLLPKLEILECPVDAETVRPFVDAVMRRRPGADILRHPLREATPAGFRAAIAYYPQGMEIEEDLQELFVEYECLRMYVPRVLRLIPISDT